MLSWIKFSVGGLFLVSMVSMASFIQQGDPLSGEPSWLWPNPLPQISSNFSSGKQTLPLQQRAHVIDADLIRVGISDDAMTEQEYPRTVISATGPFVIQDNAGQILLNGTTQQLVTITYKRPQFFVNQKPVEASALMIHAKYPQHRLQITNVTRKGKRPSYRGMFEVRPGYSSPEKLMVINVLPLSDYLKAVVPNELPPSFGFEALKAQAVAARNYAIHPREKPWKDFDICDSQYCQAYYGAATEHESSNRAIDHTHGLVALYEGQPILALYSSSHGGHSENYEYAFSEPKTDLYPAKPIPYLVGKLDQGQTIDLSNEANARDFYESSNVPSFDVLSPTYRWTRNWQRDQLEQALNKSLVELSKQKNTQHFIQPQLQSGQTIGTLKDIVVTRRGVSGKVMSIEITTDKGKWTLQKEFVIRKALLNHGKMLPSANMVFDLTRNTTGQLTAIKCYGGGFGHGVGMSQYGARYMNLHGASFTDILQHYYQNVAIGTIPLQIGPSQGARLTFYVPPKAHKAKLNLTFETAKDPVLVQLNNIAYEIKPGILGDKTVQEVEKALKPGQMNTIIIQAPQQTVARAWLELIPPTSHKLSTQPSFDRILTGMKSTPPKS